MRRFPSMLRRAVRRRTCYRCVCAMTFVVFLLYLFVTAQFIRENPLSKPLQIPLDRPIPARDSPAARVSPNAALHNLTAQQRKALSRGDGDVTYMAREQLPSWTLRVIDKGCTECLDSETYSVVLDEVIQNVEEVEDAKNAEQREAVFATPAAPLGLIGPMLFAMASVTDDVDVRAELPHWQWVSRSYEQRRALAGGRRGPASRYLVVQGVPTTDQPVRAAMRDAQRATWLSYREVARSENGFEGALLQLYVFAAAERKSYGAFDGPVNMTRLLPTVGEYAVASGRLSAPRRGDGSPVAVRSELRRVRLREGWRDVLPGGGKSLQSPCSGVETVAVGGWGGRRSEWPGSLSELAAALSLPVTPPFTAPAVYVCHASTALWQEALQHRNAVWVDMLTDRRPTTGKRIGMTISWGLPVEVGMSQKLILWLNYAYTAFPDVPYIMKGDDDAYVKVPQYLSDLRYVRAGYRGARSTTLPTVRDPPGIEKTERCVYWGSYVRNRRWGRLRYHAGSGFLVHRRVVQAVLELPDDLNGRVMSLSRVPFDRQHREEYLRLLMQYEDALMGRMIRDKLQRIRQICPNGALLYVEDPIIRHRDVWHRRALSWPLVLAHRVTPQYSFYLHYFVQNEYSVAAEVGKGAVSPAAAAAAAHQLAVAYVRSKMKLTADGLYTFPKVEWGKNLKARPPSFMAEGDNVTIYCHGYEVFKLSGLDDPLRPVIRMGPRT